MRLAFHLLTCTVVLTLLAQSLSAQNANPARFFEESFGTQYRQVLASKDFEDDLELAKQIMDAATSIQDESLSPVAGLLCDRVFSLAIADQAGYELALQAMEHRVKVLPAQAAVTRQRVEQALRRAYARERGDQKNVVGQQLVDYLVHLGDIRAGSSDFGGAARIYTQAQRIAVSIKSPGLADIEEKVSKASEREKLELRLEQVQEKFLKGTGRAAAADELVKIYLLEFDDASEAAKYAREGTDENAKRLVPFLLKDPDDVTAKDALDTGTWCETLAGEAPEQNKLGWFQRSRAYLERFMVDPEANELSRLKASIAIKRVRAEVLRLDPEYAKTVASVDSGGAISLTTGLDLSRYKINGNWTLGEAEEHPALSAQATDGIAQIMLPVAPSDSYELSLKYTRTAGEGELFVQVPIGDRVARLLLGGWSGKAAGLYPMTSDVPSTAPGEPIKNQTTVTPHTVTSEQQYDLLVRVARKLNSYAVTVTVDGATLLEWTGMPSAFEEDTSWSLWAPVAIGLGVQRADVSFADVKLKPLRGDGIVLPEPPTLVERGVITQRDGVVDLLALWNRGKDVVDGTWALEEGNLTATPAVRGMARTVLTRRARLRLQPARGIHRSRHDARRISSHLSALG